MLSNILGNINLEKKSESYVIVTDGQNYGKFI